MLELARRARHTLLLEVGGKRLNNALIAAPPRFHTYDRQSISCRAHSLTPPLYMMMIMITPPRSHLIRLALHYLLLTTYYLLLTTHYLGLTSSGSPCTTSTSISAG